jgi:hypothetical protein
MIVAPTTRSPRARDCAGQLLHPGDDLLRVRLVRRLLNVVDALEDDHGAGTTDMTAPTAIAWRNRVSRTLCLRSTGVAGTAHNDNCRLASAVV